ncbi:MAG: hypothetical protein AAB430_01745 [Patescibacteria group bacterium]
MDQSTNTLPVASPQKPFPKWPFIAIFSFLLGIASVFAYQKLQPSRIIPEGPSLSPSAVLPLPSVDPTANWKTYTNTTYKLAFKYPQNFKFEETTLGFPNVEWTGSITNPKNIVSQNTKIWDILGISIAVRGKRGLLFEEWIKDECPTDLKDMSEFNIGNKAAKIFVCSIGSTDVEKIDWKIVAIDNGTYIYTLSNNGYNRNVELDKIFNLILSTFKFTD